MMQLGSSFDENGPMTSMGQTSFSAETGLPGGRQVFEVSSYLVASDESKIIVEYDGLRLTDFGTWNDYYGFGTSPQSSLVEAAEKLKRLKGCNVDITVVTTLKRRPCFPSSDKPFYSGAQRVHYIPMTWRCMDEGLKETEREFHVWQNGERTHEALEFYDEIMRLASEDAAPQRNGELRTLATRKHPTLRDAFLMPQSQTTEI